MARALILAAGLMGIIGCTGGGSPPDGQSDTDDPMCPVIDFETVCVEHGFPHIARRWRYPAGSPGVEGLIAVTTVDDEWPPINDSLGFMPYLQSIWCAMDPERPQDSASFSDSTPTAYRLDLRGWWTTGTEHGQKVQVTFPGDDGGWETRSCFDFALPAWELSINDADGERTETAEYPWNIPGGWEQCWPDPTVDQTPCPTE